VVEGEGREAASSRRTRRGPMSVGVVGGEARRRGHGWSVVGVIGRRDVRKGGGGIIGPVAGF